MLFLYLIINNITNTQILCLPRLKL
ncbi:hypothetical protein EZS27_027599, partial [termite gut metagenome]